MVRHESCRCLFFLVLLLPQAAFVARSSHVEGRKSSHGSKLWRTHSGNVPLVIARGGSSGLFPDQTSIAYLDALNNSLNPIALLCDLQMTQDEVHICRTGLDLSNSTNINQNSTGIPKSYNVNGKEMAGFFAIDYPSDEVLALGATQSIASRSDSYDGIYTVLRLEDVIGFAQQFPFNFLLWINVQYPSFYFQHKHNMAVNVRAIIGAVKIDYVSSPEVSFLRSIKMVSSKTKTKLIFQFLDQEEVEPSTNVRYGSLLKNLKFVSSFASGILVPKTFIWPVDAQTSYLKASTTLLSDAHRLGLEVYASGFVNDPIVPVYNYSFDPIREYLQFTSGSDVVDGFMTDFPTTASEAIGCYGNSSQANTTTAASDARQLVISHNGASGDFPGCTVLAYENAIKDGADYIDCPIQMTRDGIPICRESPDLLSNTDISLNSNLLEERRSSITQFQKSPGLFSVNMTIEEIRSLKAIMYSPEQDYGLERNPAFDGTQSVLTLTEFLNLGAVNGSKGGILIDIQNAYFLETALHLDVVNSVLSALYAAGYKNSSKVVIQSEDSAVLKRFQQSTSYTLVYRVADENVIITNETVQQIKSVAGIVSLPRGLVTPANKVSFFLDNLTNIVEVFKTHNMRVFVAHLRNEYVALPFDYEADPTLELRTMFEVLKVDGVATDFPATARAYLGNKCRRGAKSPAAYTMHLVEPGELLTTFPPVAEPPVQLTQLRVAEPALPPSVSSAPLAATSPSISSPKSSELPSAGSQVPCFNSTIWILLVIVLCV